MLAKRYEEIKKTIQAASVAAGKPPVRLIAVSKGQPAEKIKELYDLGHRFFGENYVQELAAKWEQLKFSCPEIRWHFIGHVQSNKVKQLVQWVAAVHTIDSVKLVETFETRWRAIVPIGKLGVFIEVNIDGEASKNGVPPSQVEGLARRISQSDELECLGLMCVPKPGGGPEAFQALAQLERSLRPMTLGNLSMGMSEDYLSAIQCGATHVRVGSALFGPRS